MTPDELIDAVDAEVTGKKRRGFAPGLLMTFVDFLRALGLPREDIRSYDDLMRVFPRQEVTRAGTHANTLIVESGATTVSIRPFYNEVLKLIRTTHHRFDYPKSAPHSTQAWQNYIHWLDALCGMDMAGLDEVREKALAYVLKTLPDQGFDPESQVAPSADFVALLEEFDFVAPKGEPSGAAFQGAVFGFIRADNPHLQVHIGSVRSGGKREERIGDVDAWDGERLAVTAEVKNFQVGETVVDDLEEFIHEANRRNAIGLIVAQDFTAEARERITASGVVPLDVADLTQIVQLWDPAKQRIAVESLRYYAKHVEKKSVLVDRINMFFEYRASLAEGGEPTRQV